MTRRLLVIVVLLLATAASAEGASAALAPPVAVGTLRVSGTLRVGAPVTATGLRWHVPALPAGDRLLSFNVAYTWNGIVPVSPFAARRNVLGVADAGRPVTLTETATEVIETDPATFTFKVKRASQTVTTTGSVAGYPAHQAPVSRFINGTPEARTGSREEYFQVAPAVYAAADGVPAVDYRIDSRGWKSLPASGVFFTGTLGLGPHSVKVRTSNSAGTTYKQFSWRVVKLPAPARCRGCWYPQHLDSTGHPTRWDWQIGRVTPLQRTGASAVDIYDIDGFLTTAAEIRQIHTTWQAATLPHPGAVCYLDLAWEDYRPDAGLFPAATLGKVYYGYAQERWVDFRQLDSLKPMLDARIAMCARKGFDAVELDDIDSFDPPSTTGFRLTPGDAQNYLAYVDNLVHRDGMTVLWKNSAYLASWGRRYTDGAVVEECYTFSPCFSTGFAGQTHLGVTCTALSGPTPCGWDAFTTDVTPQQPTGKWVGEIEYGDDHFVCNPGKACAGPRAYSAYCKTVYAPSYGFSAAKLDVDLDGNVFFPCPEGR